MNLTRGDLTLAYLYVLFLGGVIVLSTHFGGVKAEANASHSETPFALAHNLEASAAAVYDVKEGKYLYGHNTQTQLPIASITKLATALLARENATPESEITIPPAALGAEGDSGLYARETWRLQDLIDLTLVSSSNDGAAALALAFSTSTPFIEQMNLLAHKLGLVQTYFLNPTGLDLSENSPGAYSSAEDVVKLVEYIVQKYPTLLERTGEDRISVVSQDGLTHEFKNTNTGVESALGVFASKTGFTDLAGGNLAVVFDAGPDRPMIAVVLGSTAEERFSDVETLIESTFTHFAAQQQNQ